MAIGFYRLPPWRTEKRNERTFSTGGCRCPSCRYGNTLPRQSRCGSALPMACGMLRFRYFSDFSGGTGAKAGLRPAKNSRAVRCGISSGMRRVCGFSGRYGIVSSSGYSEEISAGLLLVRGLCVRRLAGSTNGPQYRAVGIPGHRCDGGPCGGPDLYGLCLYGGLPVPDHFLQAGQGQGRTFCCES